MALSFAPDKDDKSSGKNNENSSASNRISIITDEPITEAPDFDKYSQTLSNIIVNSVPRFTVGIYGGWGTGKTTIMQMIQKHLDEEYKNDIITIWFDAWRYEYEEFSALVPLVRTIILHLEVYIEKLEFEKNPKKVAIRNLADKFKKLSKSIIMNSKTNLGPVGMDPGKIIEDYISEGSFHKNQERIYFHKHISDFVRDELKDIRGLKMVIFIDDLDRCTPERALEILESIKTFFDIEGIIFVIGIDPSTIDPIIKTKYGKDSKIDGMKYLQKIVQLPYTIPLWNPPRLSDTITNMMTKTHLPNEVIEKVLDPKMQELIIRATELNPRDVKRFINSIVISHEVYGHEIYDIEKIIVIQAFYFHGEKWIEFLKLLIPYKPRIGFLTHFIMWLEKESTNISSLHDLKNILLDNKTLENDNYIYKSLADKSLREIYKTLIDIDDSALFAFLRVSKEKLLRIDKIEKYLMVMDPTGMTGKPGKLLDIDSRKQSDLIRNRKVDEFNSYVEQEIPIHLPFENLTTCDLNDLRLGGSLLFRANLSKVIFSGSDLRRADLSEAILISTNLSEANLSRADLSRADLFNAKLFKANLSGAYLMHANLSEAVLEEANLTKGKLSKANLSRAFLVNANLLEADLRESNLPEANLLEANLSEARMSEANLSRADLSYANLYRTDLSKGQLSGANLSGANLSGANLSGAKLLNTVIIDTEFSNVIIDANTDFSGAILDNRVFLKQLYDKGFQNLPNQIKDKRELREELRKTLLDQEDLDFYLSLSKLPEN